MGDTKSSDAKKRNIFEYGQINQSMDECIKGQQKQNIYRSHQ
jgi:hypothetical protein